MKANSKFLNLPLEFWANVRLISQEVGYTNTKNQSIKVPTVNEIVKTYQGLNLDTSRIINGQNLTEFGTLLLEYFNYRATALDFYAKSNLMKVAEAGRIFNELFESLNPKCPLPFNKQKNEKKARAYFTGIINMLIEANINDYSCDYSPGELTTITENKFPVRVLSRRVDGAFPDPVNPLAIWEIKEYYYTTTFGSRVADGVYETLLDGLELAEAKQNLNRPILHYLMIDDYFTWWEKGRSYLCRICDMVHIGILTEVFFGKEVLEGVPRIAKEWVNLLEQLNFEQ